MDNENVLRIYEQLKKEKFLSHSLDRLHVIACLYKDGKLGTYDLIDICGNTLLTAAIEVVLELESRLEAPINEAIKQEVIKELELKREQEQKALERFMQRYDDGHYDKSC
jgi:hypothetical protein